jgi:hypothetical protein
VPPFTDTFRARVTAWLAAAGSRIFADGFELGDESAWSPAG